MKTLITEYIRLTAIMMTIIPIGLFMYEYQTPNKYFIPYTIGAIILVLFEIAKSSYKMAEVK